MVIFEKAALRATSRCADKCALAAVAIPDGTLHGGRDVATGTAGGCRPRVMNVRMSRLAQFRQQHRQRPIEDGGKVAVRDPVAEQVSRLAQPVVRLT
jgi:hypothetical protein